MPRLLVPLLALALLAAACAAEPDGYDVADRVLDELGPVAAAPEPSDLEDCERRVEIDEYGFETEVFDCPEGVAPPTPVAALDPDAPFDPEAVVSLEGRLPLWVTERLVAAVPADLADGVGRLVERLEDLEAACGVDLEAWRAELGAMEAEAVALVEAVGEGAAADWIGSAEARALGRSLFERGVLETGCAAPGEGGAVGDPELTLATAGASAAVAELDRVLAGSLSSRLFHFFSTLPAYEWMRTQVDPPGTVVLGTSQAGALIDVPTLADGIGAPVGNAFLPGSLAEVQTRWLDEVQSYVAPERVILTLGAIDLLLDCEPDGRDQQFTERLTNRRDAFARSGWLDGVDPVTVVLGPPGPPDTNLGNGIKADAPSPDAVAAQFEEYRDRMAVAAFCERRADVIADMATRLEADGVEVAVVALPLNPVSAELLDDPVARGREAFDRLVADHLDGLELVTVDLTDALQDDPEAWADLTHTTGAGATTFSVLLAERLAEAGW